ncbi:MAG: glycosyltransferase [Acidimicrobiales bacterium]
MSTVAYLTKRFPRLSETFILDEIVGLEAAGVPLRLYALAHPAEARTQTAVAQVASPVTYLHPVGHGFSSNASHVLRLCAAHLAILRGSPRRYVGVVLYIARKRRHVSTVRHFLEAGLLASLLEADGATHLHAAFAHGPASVAHFVHLLTGVPFSFAGHAKDLYTSAPDLLARKIAACEFVLACSESAASYLRGVAAECRDPATRDKLLARDRIILLRHGVDTERFRPPALACAPGPAPGPAGATASRSDPASTRATRLLLVGRLVPKKGHAVLLEACAKLAAEGVDLRCDLVGGGELAEELKRLADRLGLSANITFHGAKLQDELPELFANADIFVQPSVVVEGGDRDGIPNALLEAMATGLPVVATTVGGIPEVVEDARTGLLVAPGDVDALAGALRRLSRDEGLRVELGAAARAYTSANLDRSQAARRVASLFTAVPGLSGQRQQPAAPILAGAL